LRRLFALLALLVVIAIIVVAAVVISNDASSTAVHYQKVVGHDAQSAVDQLKQIINKYSNNK
jgi:uncharacterized protein YpmS